MRVAGPSVRGFNAAPFKGGSVTSWTTARAGACSPVDGRTRVMSQCSGGLTQTSNAVVTSYTWTWTAPAAGIGAVTIWSVMCISQRGANYEVKLVLQESAGTPSNTPTPTVTPTATPSNSGTPSETPSNSGTASQTPTQTRTSTRTPSTTASHTPAGSGPPSMTPTRTPTVSLTQSPGTATSTPTPSITASASGTPTPCPTVSASATPSPSTSPGFAEYCPGPETCSDHGTCSVGYTSGADGAPAGAGPVCACAIGYSGDYCEYCADAFVRADFDDGTFNCSLHASTALVTLRWTVDAALSLVGAADSIVRVNAQLELGDSIATSLGIGRSRVTVNITDAAAARMLAHQLFDQPARSIAQQRSPQRALDSSPVIRITIAVSVAPSVNASQASSVEAAALLAQLASSSSPSFNSNSSVIGNVGIIASLAAIGVNVSQLLGVQPEVSYSSAAPQSICDLSPSACYFSFTAALTNRMALSWRIDDAQGVIHMQLAYVFPSLDDVVWFGIAFNDGPGMVGGDSITIEPGKAIGQQVNRCRLAGYTMSTCPIANDATLVGAYSSVNSFTGAQTLGIASAGGRRRLVTAATAPAVRALSSALRPSSVVLVSTFTRTLATPLIEAGSRIVDPANADSTWVTWAWGPPGATQISTHTSATSGAMQVNLATGEVLSPAIKKWAIAAHGVATILGLLVFLPAAALITRYGRHFDPQAVRKHVPGVDSKAVHVSPLQASAGDPTVDVDDRSRSPNAWWRRAHSHFSWTGLVLAVAGTALGVYMTPSTVRATTAHAFAGFAVMAGLLFMAVLSLGCVRPRTPTVRIGSPIITVDDNEDDAYCSVCFHYLWVAVHVVVGCGVIVCSCFVTWSGALDARLSGAGILAASLAPMLLMFVYVCVSETRRGSSVRLWSIACSSTCGKDNVAFPACDTTPGVSKDPVFLFVADSPMVPNSRARSAAAASVMPASPLHQRSLPPQSRKTGAERKPHALSQVQPYFPQPPVASATVRPAAPVAASRPAAIQSKSAVQSNANRAHPSSTTAAAAGIPLQVRGAQLHDRARAAQNGHHTPAASMRVGSVGASKAARRVSAEPVAAHQRS